jgi:predicted nuclease of predicted toxin-antitoxin system
MRILLDECWPQRLADQLPGHTMQSVRQAGFLGVKNGALLKLVAESGFDAFITVDKNLAKQQNLRGMPFIIVVLRARSNQLSDLAPLAPELLQRLALARTGEVLVVQ